MLERPSIVDEHEVLIRQSYAAVNYGDVTRRSRGMFPADQEPPYVLGFEGVGIVDAVGPAVSSVAPGDRVSYLTERGGYGEFVIAAEAHTWHPPSSISDPLAASFTCAGLTAWGLIQQAGVKSGDTVLVHGAAGGVGTVLVQMLASLGVRPIACVRGSRKRDYLERIGCEDVIDTSTTSLAEVVGSYGSGSVSCVFDCVGQAVVEWNLALLRPGGTWMYFGSTSGHPEFPGAEVLMRQLRIQGFVVFDFVRDAAVFAQGASALCDWLLNDGTSLPPVEVVPIDKASEAHTRLELREIVGKIVLSFGD
jgi:NADPH2:quinone reductase